MSYYHQYQEQAGQQQNARQRRPVLQHAHTVAAVDPAHAADAYELQHRQAALPQLQPTVAAVATAARPTFMRRLTDVAEFILTRDGRRFNAQADIVGPVKPTNWVGRTHTAQLVQIWDAMEGYTLPNDPDGKLAMRQKLLAVCRRLPRYFPELASGQVHILPEYAQHILYQQGRCPRPRGGNGSWYFDENTSNNEIVGLLGSHGMWQ